MKELEALKKDHEELRGMIDLLKSEKPNSEKRFVYARFARLLKSHTAAEEAAVYQPCLELRDLKKEVFEGFTEHEIAEMLMAKIPHIRQPEKWRATVEVLAEMVEHHLEEEETDLFPELDQILSPSEKMRMEVRFLEIRRETQGAAQATGALLQ